MRRLFTGAFAALIVVGCSDSPLGTIPEANSLPELIVSEALPPADATTAPSAGSVLAMAFVSLPPGTLVDAVSVRIRNITTGGGATVPLPIMDGGFDPVAVPASAGDRLELAFTDGIGVVTEEYATVPAKRPLVVVRTAPSNGRTDVALSVRPVVVFSEPIDPATLPVGMRLVTGGTLVNGRVELLEPWLAELVPASPLEPGAGYALEITLEIRGVDGVTLEAPISADFTTEPSGSATSGVIGISVDASGPNVNGVFGAMLDGEGPFFVGPGGPHYMTGVSPGDHVVSLVGPAHCSIETSPQSVTVTVGGPARDTVAVAFSVTCGPSVGAVRITAPTTGLAPASIRYRVIYQHYGYWDYGGTLTELGTLEPNGTLIAEVPASRESGADPYWYLFHLTGVPANCVAHDPNPVLEGGLTITFGDTLDIEYPVVCTP